MALQAHKEALLSRIDEAIDRNETATVAEAFKEALHLDPNDIQLRERWSRIHSQEAGGEVLDVLRKYVGSQQEAEGNAALAVIRQKRLSTSAAVEAVELLLEARTSPPLLDALTAAVLSANIEARKHLAVKISKNPTSFFGLIFARGPESFNALISLTLETSLWPSKEAQTAAQRDVFRLSVVRLIAAGAEHLDRAMKAITRLLSFAAKDLVDLIDADVFDSIFECLDIREDSTLRSQTTLAAAKLFETAGPRGEEMFSTFIHDRVKRQTNSDLIVAFSAAAAVFPLVPAITSRLFLVDGFVQQLVPNLERNWDEGAAGKRKSSTLETSALQLLSAACVDKACREAIKRYCSHWLRNLAEERQGTHKALAALTLAKISPEISENMTEKLENLVLTGDVETDQAIEGLAYTTLEPRVKEEVAENRDLLQKLVTALKERPSSTFGCLTVFTNLTTYRLVLSEEQKKMAQLKAYANSEQLPPDDPLDDDSYVTARCKSALDAEVVPALVVCCKHTTSPTNIALVVRILLSIAKEQRHRARMAQQGAVKLLLQIHNKVSNIDKATPDASIVDRQASHALARLLISLNPSHIFSSALPASSAVSALIPLLSALQDTEHRDLLPTFESLLALTNLASMDDNSVRDQQLRLLWTNLEDDLLLSSNTMIQRASVELLCNLMATPQCVAKFVGDGSKREPTRMRILLALTDVEDLATRRAAGGALASLTEWDAAVAVILELDIGVHRLLAMCADESDEVKHRGLVCVMNMIGAPGEIGAKGLANVKAEFGADIVKKALKQTRNAAILEVGVQVLKKLI